MSETVSTVGGAAVAIEGHRPQVSVAPKAPKQDLAYWRKLAIESGKRIEIMETQAKALREAADEARARFSKYKGRLDNAQARTNELEAERIALALRVEELQTLLARQAEVARKVYEFRQSILDGPLWALFAELSVSPEHLPGVE